jgi:hypothetical protein
VIKRASTLEQLAQVTGLPLDALTKSVTEYNADHKKRAKEEGRVVVRLVIGPAGVPEEPIDIDLEQSTSYPRLLDAARRIFRRRQFAIGDGYRRTVTASVVFEMAPCGHTPHAKDVNFYVDVCLEPRQ